MLENSFDTRSDLVGRISTHYYHQLLYEMYKVLGSFDIIGNPVSLVSNLGTGVHDFFYEPARGFVQSPMDFVLGVGKGSSSLVKNSVVGIFGTASKITGTLGKGVAHLTFDKDYVRSRDKHVREKPKHIGEGMVWGAKELRSGIKSGLTGIVTSPLDGAKREGVQGFMKGMGKGVIGAAVKPGVGLFDMATRATQGITNFALNSEMLVRVRPPRGFGPERILRLYDTEKALGQSILRSLDEGAYASEWHLLHCVSDDDAIILLSNKRIFSISVEPQLSAIWSCLLADIQDIHWKGNCVQIEVQPKASDSSLNWLMGIKEVTPLQIFQLNMKEATAKWLADNLRQTIDIVHRFDQDDDDLAFLSGPITTD